MNTKLKVSFATKLLSNSHYLSEVAVEKKKCSRFYQRLYLHDLYTRQLIRNGNCITLLSNPITITAAAFWDPLQIEELVKYVFWTFNKSFLLLITDSMPLLSVSIVQRCQDLLVAYPTAYSDTLIQDADEEVLWCLQKNSNLMKYSHYELMYRLDKENRAAILEKLQETSRLNQKATSIEDPPTLPTVDAPAGSSTQETKIAVTFLHLLKPIKRNRSTTLKFIQDSLAAAEFTFDLFSPVEKVSNGRNPHGLNGQVAAMIDFFYQHNYFVAGIDERQIFTAYFQFTGNRIPKLGHYYAQFRADPTYIRYFNKLKELKINKL